MFTSSQCLVRIFIWSIAIHVPMLKWINKILVLTKQNSLKKTYILTFHWWKCKQIIIVAKVFNNKTIFFFNFSHLFIYYFNSFLENCYIIITEDNGELHAFVPFIVTDKIYLLSCTIVCVTLFFTFPCCLDKNSFIHSELEFQLYFIWISIQFRWVNDDIKFWKRNN